MAPRRSSARQGIATKVDAGQHLLCVKALWVLCDREVGDGLRLPGVDICRIGASAIARSLLRQLSGFQWSSEFCRGLHGVADGLAGRRARSGGMRQPLPVLDDSPQGLSTGVKGLQAQREAPAGSAMRFQGRRCCPGGWPAVVRRPHSPRPDEERLSGSRDPASSPET